MGRTLVTSVTLADCDVQTFRAGGKGGQNQNKRDTGVRIIHRASGARGESREHKSQLQNKRAAFRRMATDAKFTQWVRVAAGRSAGMDAEIAAEVERQMRHIRVEVRDDDGRWVQEQPAGPVDA